MARWPRWGTPLRIAFAVVVAAALWQPVLQAAPGPVKRDAEEVGTAEPVAAMPTGSEPAPEATVPPDDAGQGRVDYQRAPGPGDVAAPPVSSHRRISHGSGADGIAQLQAVAVGADVEEAEPAAVESRAVPAVELASAPYRILRSGRPRSSGDSSFAYDGDPATSWTAGDAAPMAYAWFDLGREEPVVAVRWLQTAVDGLVAVQVSSDREQWTTVARQDAAPPGEWQQQMVGERARYVRLVFAGSDEQAVLADLAEIAIFGPPGSEPPVRSSPPAVRSPQASEQDVGVGQQADRGAGPSVDADPDADVEIVEAGDAEGRREPPEIETTEGESDCDGNGRCVIRGPRVDVREDCGGRTSTCTIDISVDGGRAICDTAGGHRNRAGDGNGRRNGNGDTCEARATGGTVEVGEINP